MFIKHHSIKIEPRWFHLAEMGIKPFEIRNNDRDYNGGDFVTLAEFDPENQKFTGREINGIISYVCDYEQKENMVVFAYVRISPETFKKLIQAWSNPSLLFSDYKAPIEEESNFYQSDFYKRHFMGDFVKTNESRDE